MISPAIQKQPWQYDFFSVLRWLERTHPERPRIGDAASRREEFALLGQDPFMDYPASTLSLFEVDPSGPAKIRTKFLGLLGPQGALPLATTEEAYGWFLADDDSFPRFLDIINHRFLQLFFRAWADARPVAQHDRPNEDRFETYVGSSIGTGSPVFRNLDTVSDRAKLAFAGLLGSKVKSAARLSAFIRGYFNVDNEINEFVGSRLILDVRDRPRLGAGVLGADILIGATFYSVQDKIRIRIYVDDMSGYRRFLPEGDCSEPLVDMVFFYTGDEIDWDLELAIRAKSVEPIKLGHSGDLGWTTWMAPDWSALETYRSDARFNPAERLRAKRAKAFTRNTGARGGNG
ncbi:MAG TPA: type VI secretion system baseplate subunit TssG [Methylocella sp.]|nr:type VI secretion system baseplate subunit TssG [Methylocella sp.]